MRSNMMYYVIILSIITTTICHFHDMDIQSQIVVICHQTSTIDRYLHFLINNC